MFKQYYQQFLDSVPGRLHFAAHSHHYWPDVTRQAIVDYWDDSARHADDKWTHIWGEIIPRAQRHIARILGISAPEQVVFAPNTHEFVCRLLSCFEGSRPVRLLSTDGEFHSFRRQARRWQEVGQVELTLIESEPIGSFPERLVRAAQHTPHDLVFFSQVFFNSGLAVDDVVGLVKRLPAEPMVVVDGYHGFCALPTDLSSVQDRIFYLAGGYKYAQAGEGACFMCVPRGCRLRPVNTGWFASFGSLEAGQSDEVQYSDSGLRFAGATFDPSGLYRFNAVMDLFDRAGITIEAVHEHVMGLQKHFLDGLRTVRHPLLNEDTLIYKADADHGHFLTFALPSVNETVQLAQRLAQADVIVDHRANRLRFGFGLYQDAQDVAALLQRMAALG